MVEFGASVPFHAARDPVNLPTIRRWCDAIGDHNPVHTDPTVAQRSRFDHVVAPLAMLDVWTKPGLTYVRNLSDPQGAAFDALDRQGYTSAVAVASELVQHRHLALGDTVTSTLTLDAVSPEKSTALGAGCFVTTRQEFHVDGDAVGTARFTVLKVRPAVPTPAGDRMADEAPRSAPTAVVDDEARDDLGTVVARGLRPGQLIPDVSIPITATLIVAGALMTSDYFDAHHDRDAALRRGTSDIFMNIHTTLGLVERCVGGWLGPNAAWRSMRVRLGVPNYPGDAMLVGGTVSTVDEETGDTTIDVRATNGLGVHAEGSIAVNLPR